MLVRDWEGKMVEAPADLKIAVATYSDNYIVWSRTGKRHQVRYGLEVTPCGNANDAAHKFGECVQHFAACEGKLDD